MRVGPSQRRDQQNERKGLPERPMVRKASKALAVPRQLTALKNRSRQNNRKAGEGCDRNESPDPHAVHDEKLRLTKLEQQELVSKCDHLSVPQLGSEAAAQGKSTCAERAVSPAVTAPGRQRGSSITRKY